MSIRVLCRGTVPAVCEGAEAAKRQISESLATGVPIWVDMEAPESDEVAILSDVFHFHPLAIQDCLDGLQRPKLDEYPGYLFAIVHAVSGETTGGVFRPAEFDLFISRDYVVTFHSQRASSLDHLYKDYCQSAAWRDRSTGFLVQAIMGTLVDDYFPVIDNMEDRLEGIEHRIFQKPDRDLLALSFKLRRSIFMVRKSLSPEREVLNGLLRRDFAFMRPEDRAYFMDVYDRILRLFDFADNLHELLSNAMESYLSSISNRLNETMKVLTVISTIVMPLTLIAGIYGMNFAYMPEIHWRYGYPVALLSMVVVTVIMLIYFRRKGWF
jgi:magnesium transporter